MSRIKRRVRKSLAFMNNPKLREAAALIFDEFNDIVSSDKKKKSEVDKLGRETHKPSQLVGVGRSRYQTATRRVTPTSPALTASVASASASEVKKALPNGDLYMGIFAESAPHGSRKYLWFDGCMYEREWWRRKASGKVKFSWPSRATYEGDFKYDRMECFGTFVESDGDTFIEDGG